MTAPAFTPGPWEAKSCHVIVPGKGILSLIQNPWNDNAERDANARLIAAAPELYRYLELALGVLDRAKVAWGGEPGARSVLAKARGEQVSA